VQDGHTAQIAPVSTKLVPERDSLGIPADHQVVGAGFQDRLLLRIHLAAHIHNHQTLLPAQSQNGLGMEAEKFGGKRAPVLVLEDLRLFWWQV
jgi:hypothetical protein